MLRGGGGGGGIVERSENSGSDCCGAYWSPTLMAAIFVVFIVEGWRNLSRKFLFLCARELFYFLEFLEEQMIYLISNELKDLFFI